VALDRSENKGSALQPKLGFTVAEIKYYARLMLDLPLRLIARRLGDQPVIANTARHGELAAASTDAEASLPQQRNASMTDPWRSKG
jgi:hypothetical protein